MKFKRLTENQHVKCSSNGRVGIVATKMLGINCYVMSERIKIAVGIFDYYLGLVSTFRLQSASHHSFPPT